MDSTEHVIRLFHDSIEAKASYGELLAPKLVAASEVVVETFINNGHLLIGGYGSGHLCAQYFAGLLLNQTTQERPALPGQLLDAHSGIASTIGLSYSPVEIFSRQVRAFGQPGDLLVLFAAHDSPPILLHAVQAAHERNMRVLCFNGGEISRLTQLLSNQDLEVRIPLCSEFLLQELQMLLAYALAELIDHSLFGGGD